MYSFFLTAQLSSPSQRLALCGGAHVLGGWDVMKAVQLHPVRNPREDAGACVQNVQNWTVSVNMSSMGYRYFEYRYIKFLEDGHVAWEAMKFNQNLLVVPEVNYTLHDGNFGAPPAQRGLRGPTLPAPRAWRVAICGSSVAFGWRAAGDRGWAQLLAEALQLRYGHQIVNVAVHGYTTQKTRADFQRLVASIRPDVVVIGLSLANEGLSWKSARLWRVTARSFQNGIRGLLREVEAIQASPVLGDVYPHDAYVSRLQRQLLQDTHRMLLNTSVPLLRWLPALDDGQGRWQRDHMEDAGHPNSLGHQVMFEAIDLSMFDPSNANSLRPKQDEFHP